MKTLNEYMNSRYKMEIIPDSAEGGYVVRFPELPGCITCGETIEEAIRSAEDAKREWITAAIEEKTAIPEPSDIAEYSGQFKLRIPKTLHRELAQKAKIEGVSMNQYCVHLLSKNISLVHLT